MKPIKSNKQYKTTSYNRCTKEDRIFLNHTRRREGTRRGTMYEGQGHQHTVLVCGPLWGEAIANEEGEGGYTVGWLHILYGMA